MRFESGGGGGGVRRCGEARHEGFAYLLPLFGNHFFRAILRMEVLPHGCTSWLKFLPRWFTLMWTVLSALSGIPSVNGLSMNCSPFAVVILWTCTGERVTFCRGSLHISLGSDHSEWFV